MRESCAGELALHDALLADPRRAVSARELAARRGRRTRARTTRSGCASATGWRPPRRSRRRTPGCSRATASTCRRCSSHQLTQVLLRHVLGADAEPMAARAAEMLFRPQKIAVLDDGAVMAADEATVELHATTGGFGSLGELLAQNRRRPRTASSTCSTRTTPTRTGSRDERHDFSVSLNRGRPALDALCARARAVDRGTSWAWT